MADQSQNPGTPGTSNQYPNWPQPMNWSYGNYTGSQMYNMNAFYGAQCYNPQGFQSFPSQSLNFNFKPFVHGGTLETATVSHENSPPLPNGPAPSQPPPPQFDSDDLDKLPPLPPGSPPPVPGICDVPLPPQPNLSSLPPMPQTKNGRKKWRKKQRSLMEAAMANQSAQIAPPIYPIINFVPPVPISQPPPTPKQTVPNSLFSFTPIVPSKPPPPQQPAPPKEIQSIQKKQNTFDLPDNCPSSLRDYIKKCQDKCINKIDRDRMDIILKGKLTNANHDGSLWIKDWAKEPMPMLLSENITINQNQENGKNKNSIIKIAFKKSTNNYVNCYFTSKFKSCLSPSSNSSNESNTDAAIKKKNSPLRENKRQNSDDFIPLNINSDESNSKKSKCTSKNKKLYNEDAHIYQQYGSINNKPNYDKHVLNKRAARFSSQGSPKKKPRQIIKNDYHSQKLSSIDDDEFRIDSCHIVGTCIDLEKKYLRLTAAPDAEAVRPLRVLVNSLQHVKSKWMNNSDYVFACDQLKSIRQDLTVQGIRDPFTVEVYETHARIALEKSDMGEFNQCQTQLCDLYEELKDNPTAQKNRNEFLCYSILYCIYTRALCELNNVVLCIKESKIKDKSIDFALKIKDAWWLGNHIQLFSLYKVAPKMASYLMDMFLARERNNFYLAIAKSYRPTIPISTIQDQMAFDKREDCLAFLKAAGAVFTSNNENIDCKASCGSAEA